MKITEEQTRKALECCADHEDRCKDCPLNHLVTCKIQLIRNVYRLVETLTEDNEIKSSKRANIFEITDAFERGRIDGVRKVVERLSDNYEFESRADIDTRGIYQLDLIEWVVQIAEEMAEG